MVVPFHRPFIMKESSSADLDPECFSQREDKADNSSKKHYLENHYLDKRLMLRMYVLHFSFPFAIPLFNYSKKALDFARVGKKVI